MTDLPASEWVRLYFDDRIKPDAWQLRYLEAAMREPRVDRVRFAGVDYGAGESRSVFTTWRQSGDQFIVDEVAEVPPHIWPLDLEELEPGVWGLR